MSRHGGSNLRHPMRGITIMDNFDLDKQAAEMETWWHDLASSDLKLLIPKAREYSNYDLQIIGQVMADVIGWKGAKNPTVYQELGCFWYLLGKVGRMAGAYRNGELPSDDSILDARIYAIMVARIRDCGSWPGWSDAPTT